MVLYLENATDRVVLVNFSDNQISLAPYSTTKVERFGDTEIDLCFKTENYNSITQELKDEIIFNELDLKHLSFGIKYCSHIMTRVSIIKQCKKLSLKITNDKIENSRILDISCPKAENDFIRNTYRFVNNRQKRIFSLATGLILFIKYGLISVIGLLFYLSIILDFDNVMAGDATEIVFYIVACLIFALFIGIWIYEINRVSKLKKIISKIQNV